MAARLEFRELPIVSLSAKPESKGRFECAPSIEGPCILVANRDASHAQKKAKSNITVEQGSHLHRQWH